MTPTMPIGYGLCECGCGESTTIPRRNNARDGQVKGRPMRFRHGHHLRAGGESHPRWRGGRKRCSDGYILLASPGHPHASYDDYVYEHRLVVEAALGRYLTRAEVVHHINCEKDDNRLENLMLFSCHGEHLCYERGDGPAGQTFS